MTARRIMSAEDIRRALTRIGHEIVEKHGGTERLALVGVERRGPELARRIADVIAVRHDAWIPVGSISSARFRDDRPVEAHDATGVDADPPTDQLPFDPETTTVVLIDDVLFTGRTARAAIDALIAHGRPAAVRLAVLVDRGHRELPLRADHVGKNVPTARDERVEVRLDGDDADEVRLLPAGPEPDAT